MGRKPIQASQRSQPISFSLRPHLIEKIDDYAHDMKFSRSKFLMEAVNQYMIKHQMGHYDSENNIGNMTTDQVISAASNRLQNANRDDEKINEHAIKNLKKQLEIYELKHQVRSIDEEEAQTIHHPSAEEFDITFDKVKGYKEYQIFNFGSRIGTIEHCTDLKAWITSIGNDRDVHPYLKQAKSAVLKGWS